MADAAFLASLEQRIQALEHSPVYSNWFLSTFSFEAPYNHNLVNLTGLILGSVFAGYTATALPESVLKSFEKWYYQLIIFFLVSFSTLSHPLTAGKLKFALLDALLVLALFRFVLYMLMNRDQEKRDKESKSKKA